MAGRLAVVFPCVRASFFVFRHPYIFHRFNIWLNRSCPGGPHEHGPSCLRIRQPAWERGSNHFEFNIPKPNSTFVSTGTPFLKSRQLAGAMPHSNSSSIKACPSQIQRIPATDGNLKMSAHQNVGPPKTEFPSRRKLVSVLSLKIIGFLDATKHISTHKFAPNAIGVCVAQHMNRFSPRRELGF